MNSSLITPPLPDQRNASVAGENCFANAQIVLQDRILAGSVYTLGDKIVDVREGDAVPAGATDFGGDYLVPGLVELHTDNLERHMEPRPSVELPHNTAILAHDGELASVGITTVFDALRVGAIGKEGENYKEYARSVASEILSLRYHGVLRVRHLIHLRAEVCSETLERELATFGPDDRVGLVSLMDHTPGQRQFRDLAKLKVYYAGKFGYSDKEFDKLIAFRQTLGLRVRDDHEAITLIEAARLGATLASHDDTTVEHVAKSKSKGISLAEFPTTLEAAEACRTAGIAIIMGAPNLVRGDSHSGNVSARDLAERGLLDIVSSDYVPALLMVSAFRLAAIWDDLPRAIRTVTSTPANATGLKDRGRIANGCLADVVRLTTLGDTPVIRNVWRGAQQIG